MFYLSTVLIAGVLAMSLLVVDTSKSFELAFREGFFHVISTMTTTGYSNADYLQWPLAGIMLIFLLYRCQYRDTITGSIKMARHCPGP